MKSRDHGNSGHNGPQPPEPPPPPHGQARKDEEGSPGAGASSWSKYFHVLLLVVHAVLLGYHAYGWLKDSKGLSG